MTAVDRQDRQRLDQLGTHRGQAVERPPPIGRRQTRIGQIGQNGFGPGELLRRDGPGLVVRRGLPFAGRLLDVAELPAEPRGQIRQRRGAVFRSALFGKRLGLGPSRGEFLGGDPPGHDRGLAQGGQQDGSGLGQRPCVGRHQDVALNLDALVVEQRASEFDASRVRPSGQGVGHRRANLPRLVRRGGEHRLVRAGGGQGRDRRRANRLAAAGHRFFEHPNRLAAAQLRPARQSPQAARAGPGREPRGREAVRPWDAVAGPARASPPREPGRSGSRARSAAASGSAPARPRAQASRAAARTSASGLRSGVEKSGVVGRIDVTRQAGQQFAVQFGLIPCPGRPANVAVAVHQLAKRRHGVRRRQRSQRFGRRGSQGHQPFEPPRPPRPTRPCPRRRQAAPARSPHWLGRSGPGRLSAAAQRRGQPRRLGEHLLQRRVLPSPRGLAGVGSARRRPEAPGVRLGEHRADLGGAERRLRGCGRRRLRRDGLLGTRRHGVHRHGVHYRGRRLRAGPPPRRNAPTRRRANPDSRPAARPPSRRRARAAGSREAKSSIDGTERTRGANPFAAGVRKPSCHVDRPTHAGVSGRVIAASRGLTFG